jgi:hypothetical protein
LLEQFPSLLGGKRLDQLLFGRGQDAEGLFDDATAVIVRAAFNSELSRRDLEEWPHDLAGEA